MRWCRRRRIVWFSHLPSSPRSLARTNVPWLCNQVKVAQAPPSSRHRRLANSRTIHHGTTTITTTMPPPAPIRPTDRPTRDTIPLHDRRRILSSYRLRRIKILPRLHSRSRDSLTCFSWLGLPSPLATKMQLPDAALYLLICRCRV